MSERKRIGEILVELCVLTEAEVEEVLHALRKRGDFAKFGQIAKELGYIREEHILAALAVQMQLFPEVEAMPLRRILGKLASPVNTPPPIPVSGLRRRLRATSG